MKNEMSTINEVINEACSECDGRGWHSYRHKPNTACEACSYALAEPAYEAFMDNLATALPPKGEYPDEVENALEALREAAVNVAEAWIRANRT